ncbi:serine hydrolase domain-containing protein [Aquipuribacter nitratireducens]|uniref:Serine hydrolase domain-containing protein n=1 Tax=Aquipuribacter nitratireducens TaxID=650104 RepID=A0ABW0GPM1_9MICO
MSRARPRLRSRGTTTSVVARGRRRLVCAAGAAVLLAGCSVSPAGAEQQASDRAQLAALVEADVEEYLAEADAPGKVRAVVVHHDGAPLAERYHLTDADEWWDTRSVTKSVMSTLIGIAIGDGLIDGVDATLGELLPDRRDEMTEEVAALTLHQVLTHTAGFGEEGSAADDYWWTEDWVGSILATRAETGGDVGTFAYSNAGAHLLSAVLVEATGVPVLEYAREELFDPLGIPTEPVFEPTVDPADPDSLDEVYADYVEADFAWGVDPQGLHEGSCCSKLRPRDLARLGQLYLDRGRRDGEQVLPESWVEEATRQHVEVPAAGVAGYGYMWWTGEVDGHETSVAYGRGGQAVVVVPELDLVVAVATEFDDRDPLRLAQAFGPESVVRMVELAIAPHVQP